MDQRISRKAREIQRSLDGWVKREGFLKAGERLVFSLRIEKTPVVTEDNTWEEYMRISPQEFFSRQRLVEAGASKVIATRVFAMAVNSGAKSMGEFLGQFSRTSELLKFRNFGGCSATVAAKMLLSANLPIEDDEHFLK